MEVNILILKEVKEASEGGDSYIGLEAFIAPSVIALEGL